MVKEKRPVAPRMYDADGFKKRAACICVRAVSQMEVLLVTSSRMPERWIIPGGSVEPEEDSSMAAMREVEEEAGVRGELDGMVGVFEDKDRKTRTSVYALIVKEELPEWEDSQRIGRRRKWFAVEEAAELLAAYKPIERTYLQMYQERREASTSCPSSSSLLSDAALVVVDGSSSSVENQAGEGNNGRSPGRFDHPRIPAPEEVHDGTAAAPGAALNGEGDGDRGNICDDGDERRQQPESMPRMLQEIPKIPQ